MNLRSSKTALDGLVVCVFVCVRQESGWRGTILQSGDMKSKQKKNTITL